MKTEPITRIGKLFHNSTQSLIAYFAFATARFVEINNVDHTAQRWIRFNDRADSRRELLTKRFWLLIVRPIKLFAPAHNWPTRLRRNVKPNKRMISFENFERDFLRPVSFCQPRNFIFEHIRKALDEDKWQNVIFEFRCIFFAANFTSRIPKHLLHRFGGKHFTSGCAAFSTAWRFYRNVLIP